MKLDEIPKEVMEKAAQQSNWLQVKTYYADEINTLLQESNEEAIEGFRGWWNKYAISAGPVSCIGDEKIEEYLKTLDGSAKPNDTTDKVSRVKFYSAVEYPTRDLLEKMLWDNTKGDSPVHIEQLINKHLWKVTFFWDSNDTTTTDENIITALGELATKPSSKKTVDRNPKHLLRVIETPTKEEKPDTTEHDKKIAEEAYEKGKESERWIRGDYTPEMVQKIKEEAIKGFVELLKTNKLLKKPNQRIFPKLRGADDYYLTVEQIDALYDLHLSSRGDKGEQI